MPFRCIRQMPTFGTNASHRICRRTSFVIAAALAVRRPRTNAVHRGGPGVKATILSAVSGDIVIAPTSGIGGVATIFISVFKGNISVSKIQILCHPDLRADGNRLVSLPIAFVSHSPLNYSRRVYVPFGDTATGRRLHRTTARHGGRRFAISLLFTRHTCLAIA